MRRLVVLGLALAAPCAGLARKADVPPPVCAGPVKPPLFLSPMGEPFRPKPGSDDPARDWFDQADRDHDGRLTIAELMLDADRFFALLDKDHDGQLLPDEVSAYENDVAPEVRLYQPRRQPGEGGHKGEPGERRHARPSGRSRGGDDYGGAMGAGRYAFLNIPNPVAAADADVDRAVDRAEFRRAAADRFRDLDAGQKKALSFADLPKTPAQAAANQACLDEQKAAAKAKRGQG